MVLSWNIKYNDASKILLFYESIKPEYEGGGHFRVSLEAIAIKVSYKIVSYKKACSFSVLSISTKEWPKIIENDSVPARLAR